MLPPESSDDRTEPPQPKDLTTPAALVAALRRLRVWSGLTYRQLEGKATANGDVLPASTIATALSRSTLPREQFVAALTRACGLGDAEIQQWVDARRRIAIEPGREPAAEVEPEPESNHLPRHVAALAVVGALSLLGGIAAGAFLAIQALTSDDRAETPPVPGLDLPAVGSWAAIRPARTPHFCVTEGVDRSKRYPAEIAAQRRCARSTPPYVFLEPLGNGRVQIQWHHPLHNIGCLTAIADGNGYGLLEPRDGCDDDSPAQHFRPEAVGPPAARLFRLRLGIGDDHCVSIRGEELTEGAEMVQGPCSEAPGQRFVVDLIPPPA